MNKYKQLLEKQLLKESSLSRVLQHINDPKRIFGVMSPSRKEYSDEVNENRYKELISKIRKMGYGYIPMRGGYKEEEGFVNEKSLFIPNINRTEIINLGKEYDQFSVIHKDLVDFSEIGTNQNSGIGKIINSFKIESDGRNLDLSSYELFKEFFSRLAKGSHRKKKFLFKLQEKVETSGYYKLKNGNSWCNVYDK